MDDLANNTATAEPRRTAKAPAAKQSKKKTDYKGPLQDAQSCIRYATLVLSGEGPDAAKIQIALSILKGEGT